MALAACLVAAHLVPFVDGARPSVMMEDSVPLAAAAENSNASELFDQHHSGGSLARHVERLYHDDIFNESEYDGLSTKDLCSRLRSAKEQNERLLNSLNDRKQGEDPLKLGNYSSVLQEALRECTTKSGPRHNDELKSLLVASDMYGAWFRIQGESKIWEAKKTSCTWVGLGLMVLSAAQLGFPILVRSIKVLRGPGTPFYLAWASFILVWGLVASLGARMVVNMHMSNTPDEVEREIEFAKDKAKYLLEWGVWLLLLQFLIQLIDVVASTAWKYHTERVARESELTSLADESHEDLVQDFELFQGGDLFVTPSMHPYGKAAKVTLKKVTVLISQGKDISGERCRVDRILRNLRVLLEKYNQKVADSPAVRKKMEEAFAGINEPFRNHYSSTMRIVVGKDQPAFEKLVASVQELAEKHPRPKEDMRQVTAHPIELVLHGATVQGKVAALARRCVQKGATRGQEPPTAMGASIKDFMRLQEKLGFSPEAQWNAQHVYDVAREGIQARNWEQFHEIVEAIASEHGKSIEIQRVKDRLSNPTLGGWADVMINFSFVEDHNRHICEIQIFHAKMFMQRSDMGGHEFYGQSRTLSELLDFFKFHSGKEQETR